MLTVVLEFIRKYILEIGVIIIVLGLVTGWKDVIRLSLRRIWAISSVCFAESIRRRVLWIAPLAILGVVAIAQLQHPLDEQDAIRQTVKICLFAAGLVVVVTSIILACTNLPKEIESRVIYTIVTKPTTRLEIVLGKVVGFARVSALILAIMGLFSYVYLHIRAYSLESTVRARLQSEPVGSASRETLEHYVNAGLLDTRSMEMPQDLQVLGRIPTGEPIRWISGGTGLHYVTTFNLKAEDKKFLSDARDRGAGIFLFSDLRFEHRVPTPEEAEALRHLASPLDGLAIGPAAPSDKSAKPVPQIRFELRDQEGNRLVDPSLLNGGQAVNVPQPGSPTPALLSLIADTPGKEHELIDKLVGMNSFEVVVSAVTPSVDYGVPQQPTNLVIIEPNGSLAGKIESRQGFPHFGSTMGRYGQQIAGRAGDEGPVAVFDFADPGSPSVTADGNVVFELRTGVENAGDTAANEDVENLPLVSLKVRDPRTGNVSEPVLVRPEINRVSYVQVPRAALPGGAFQVLLHARTPGVWIGVQTDRTLALAKGNRSFAFNLVKSLLVLWFLSVLVVSIAIFCSTFVSWPIAVVLTLVMLFGRWGVDQIGDIGGADLGAQISGTERDPVKAAAIRETANVLSGVLRTVSAVMPDISQFSPTEHIALGVSIPWHVMGDALKILSGYGLALVVLSYLILRGKEVAP